MLHGYARAPSGLDASKLPRGAAVGVLVPVPRSHPLKGDRGPGPVLGTDGTTWDRSGTTSRCCTVGTPFSAGLGDGSLLQELGERLELHGLVASGHAGADGVAARQLLGPDGGEDV